MMRLAAQTGLGARILHFLSRFCVAAGATLITVCASYRVGASVYQAHYDRRFNPVVIASAPEAMSSTAGAKLDVGSPIGKIQVPRLGLSVVILEGDDDRILRLGAGHIPGTAWLGQTGNTGIAAHRDTFFRPLRLIRSGDLVRLVSENQAYDYRVEFTEVVTPNRVEVLDQTAEPTLTLVTCYPFFFVGPSPKRFIVRAQLQQPQR
jgi:sortase A